MPIIESNSISETIKIFFGSSFCSNLFLLAAHVVVAERVLVFRIMLVDDEFGSVVAVQSVFGGNPYHAVPVLIYLVDQTAGQFPVCCEEFI